MADSSATKSRIGWVDQARGIGIVLVVFGHTIRGLSPAGILSMTGPLAFIDQWLYSFHMPLFFFLSGLFLADRVRRPPASFLGGLTGSFVYPYLIWSVVWVLLQTTLRPATDNPVQLETLALIPTRPLAHFWFLYVISLIHFAFFLLHRIGLGPRGTFVVFSIWAALFPWFPTGTWGPLILARRNAPFVALGAALNSMPRFAQWPDRLPTLVAGLLALLGYGATAAIVVIANRSPLLVSYLAAATGIASSIALAAIFQRWRAADWLAILGRYSLQIYLLHTFASAAVLIALQRLGLADPFLHLTAGTFAGLVMPLTAACLADRVGAGFLFRLKLPLQGSPRTSAPPRIAREAVS
jgi:fucose 4-O-acetylase-like acetyltransferase